MLSRSKCYGFVASSRIKREKLCFVGIFLLTVLLFSPWIFYSENNTFENSPKEEDVREYKSDVVAHIPHAKSQPKTKQFSGYLSAGHPGVKLHYWLVESTIDDAPLVLWLNGGPGCSSLFGYLTENGPYMVKSGPELVENPYSWNLFANMLYLESPAGVGFSLVSDELMSLEDNTTTLHAHNALKHFVVKFPRYENRDFFITGESYAGTYIPLLAAKMVENKISLHLKGVGIGNGILHKLININSRIHHDYYQGFLPTRLWDSLEQSCCPSTCTKRCLFSANLSLPCQSVVDYLYRELHSSVKPYNVFRKCDSGILKYPPYESGRELISAPKDEQTTCRDDSVIKDYLNLPEVQSALHVRGKWQFCNKELHRRYTPLHSDLNDEVKKILKANIAVMLYSGNFDARVSHLGTRWFVEQLNLPIERELTRWLYIDEDGKRQLGGFYETYWQSGAPLWFVTVHGAGHMVPTDKQRPAFHLMSTFLHMGNLSYLG